MSATHCNSIHEASSNGCLECLQRFISNGVNVNDPDLYGYYTIIHATRNNHIDCLNVLIRNGANVNSKHKSIGSSGWSSLHYASICGYSDIVKILLSNSADVNKQDYDKTTPLHLAARFQKISIVTILLNNGANAYIMNKYNHTPYDYATDPSIKQLIDEYFDVPIKEPSE
jgi:ankyrin repeat protein